MAPSISSEAVSVLKSSIDAATTSDTPALPGAIVHIVDKNNNILFSHASGGGPVTLSPSTIVVVHSISKMVGAIAYMQLVERGLASLDDSSLIEKHLPELWNKKVLLRFDDDGNGGEKPIFEDRKGEITARMLMDHTNGTGHSFFNAPLSKYLQTWDGYESRNEGTDPYQCVLDSPLLWQPGTRTNYGQGFDWLAVLIERITQQSLAVYLEENIFSKLGLKRIGYEEQFTGNVTSTYGEGEFWPRSMKGPDGKFITIDPPVLATVERKDKAYPEGKWHGHPLGTGLVASAEDISRILTILLNSGVDPITGTQIISPESVQKIETPSLPEHLRNNARIVPSSHPIIIEGNLEVAHMDPQGSFGLACAVQGADRVLKDGRKGRSKGTVSWYGAANTDFWVDKENGVVVWCHGNFYPWNEEAWVDLVAKVEGEVYEGLRN